MRWAQRTRLVLLIKPAVRRVFDSLRDPVCQQQTFTSTYILLHELR